MIRILTLLALFLAMQLTPAHARPKVDSILLPDGTTLTLVTDSKFQLFAPSTTTRIGFHCSPVCAKVDAETSGAAVLSGVWGAAGQALRRPDKVFTTIANGSQSTGSSAATGAVSQGAVSADASARPITINSLSNDQTQGQLALGGAGGAVVGSGNSSSISAPVVAPVIAPVITPVTTVAPTIAPVTVIENTGTQTCSGLGCSNN